MSVDVDLTGHGLDVTFSGIDALMSLQRSLHLEFADIVRASVAPQKTLRTWQSIGWRIGGGYWPGWFATGHYTVPGRKGARQLWCVYRAPEVLVLETRLERPARVVLQVTDPHGLAAVIERSRPHSAS